MGHITNNANKFLSQTPGPLHSLFVKHHWLLLDFLNKLFNGGQHQPGAVPVRHVRTSTQNDQVIGYGFMERKIQCHMSLYLAHCSTIIILFSGVHYTPYRTIFFSAQDAPCRVGRSQKGARARIASANQYLTGPPDSCTLSVRHLVMVIF